MTDYDERVNDEADEHAQIMQEHLQDKKRIRTANEFMREAQRLHKEILDADPFHQSRLKEIEKKKRNQGRQQ